MKKNILITVALPIAIVPLPIAVSCGVNVKKNIQNTNAYSLKHDFSFLESSAFKNWSWYFDLEKNNHDFLNSIKIDENTFSFTTLTSSEFNGEQHVSELIKSKLNGTSAISYISLFPKGTKSNILTPKKGIVNWEKFEDMNGIENYRFASNFQSFAMNQGGCLNLDLIYKDGIIYNIPVSGYANNSVKSSIDVDAGVAMTKNGDLRFLKNIPNLDDSLIKLHLTTKYGDILSKEKKGVSWFDVRRGDGIDESTKDELGGFFKMNYKSPIDNLKDGDVWVVDEYFKDQKTPMDLSSNDIHAYLVEASSINGITTVENKYFSDVVDIIQAPFDAKVTKEIPKDAVNIKNYVVPSGKALIVTKGDAKKFDIGDEISARYKFDEMNSLSDSFKDIEWATTAKDFYGNRRPINNVVMPGDEERISCWTTNAAYVVRDGEIPYSTHREWIVQNFGSTNINVGLNYFVEMNNGDFGFVSFAPEHFGEVNHQITWDQSALYLKSIGVKNALSLDGGGSSQQVLRDAANNFIQFPKSTDASGTRVLPSVIAIGGRND